MGPVALRLRRHLILAVRTVVLVSVGFAVYLFFAQDRMLWHPRAYARGEIQFCPRHVETLAFRTAQGSQNAYYAPPRDGRAQPGALCVCFAGNGSLALDWDDVAAHDQDPGRAFLFVDYPGYGPCEGKPTPDSIRENAAAAMTTLAKRLGLPDAPALERTLTHLGEFAVAGHSMGTGPALDFAASHPAVSRIILAAPFTSLRDMAQQTVGWPLCWVLRGNFDNRLRLNELAARSTPPQVFIFHGAQDELIPPDMGRALAAAHPTFAHFESVPNANHGDVVASALPRLVATLNGLGWPMGAGVEQVRGQ